VEAARRHRLRAEPVALAQDHGDIGHAHAGTDHEHAAHVADEGRSLGIRSNHETGRVAQGNDRQVEGIAELQEARRLVGRVRVDGAAEVHRVVGQHPDRPTVEAGEGGHHAGGEAGTQLKGGTDIEEALDDGVDVVGAAALGGDHVAQRQLVGRLEGGAVPLLEEREIAPGGFDGRRIVGDGEVDDPVRPLHLDGADLLGRELPEAAPLDHRRAAHADVGVLGGDDDIAAAEQCGVAGEAPTEATPTSGTSPLSAAKRANASVSSPLTTAVSVSPGRPPPPSAKSTTGTRSSATTSKSRSFFLWFIWPCVPARTM